MIQVKEFRDMRVYDSRTGDWKGKTLEESINLFLSANPRYKLLDIKYSQATNGYSDDIDSTSCALIIYEK